ncbi:MAG: COG3014 family protein [Oligoflexus sp.]
MASLRLRLIWLLLLFQQLGCASYTEEIRDIRLNYQNGRYEDALQRLEKSALQKQDRHRVLMLLEQAMIQDRLGEYAKSRHLLLEASRTIDELYTVSVSQELATYVYNESAQSYSGEDYEKVAVHTMLALSFLGEGNLESAGVEARRINNRLAELNQAYGEKKNRYGEDAFARYLSAMIYEARGEWDSAIIDYKNALRIYEGDYNKHFSTQFPSDLVSALHRNLLRRGRKEEATVLARSYPRYVQQLSDLRQKGELVVIHELGMIAEKNNYDHLIPWGKEIIRLSFPIIRPRSPSRFGRTGVRRQGQPFIAAQLAQNMDKIAAETLEDRRFRMVAKQAARLIAKSQLSQQAEKQFGGLAGLAVNVVGAVTETADTRSWTLLPSAFYVTRYQLPPGVHKVELFSNGRLSDVKEIKIKSGEIQFLRDRA